MSKKPEQYEGAKSQEQVIHHESRRKQRDVPPARMQLNLTSMIDVIFQLLIYFVVTASFAAGEGIITAKLPQGTGTSAEEIEPPEKPLNIVIGSAGDTGYSISIEGLNRAPADFDQLAEILRELQYDPERGLQGAYKPDHPVIIKPDGLVRWQHVVNTFNAAVAARYSNVSFAQARRS